MNDNFSIRGEVKLVDRQGNVLIDDHNMVVKLGRTFIRDRVLGKSTSTISNLKFGYSQSLYEVTESDKNIDGIVKNFPISLNDESDDIPSDITSIDPDNEESFIKYEVNNVGENDHPYIRYVAYIHDENLGLVNQLGLFTSDDNLFSKLVFEDVAVTRDRDYLLTYTLYF